MKKIKSKVAKHGLTYQKLGELLFSAYIKGNKEVLKLVEQYVDEKGLRKKGVYMDTIESEELLRQIEELSPLQDEPRADDVIL